ncbi:MAG: flagellar accessory protein FlaH [Chloroflexi bacterium]|jgi:archaeal flagellar protein FlaH|nr:flagellar accessory protein FlaH [Chloroflexota bacterium]
MAFLLDDEKEKKEITTGSAEIDRKMGGGIPSGSLTLIEGQSDAGKSVLTQQMIWGSLACDCRCTLFTTESTVKSLMKQMNSLGLDVLDYLLLDRLRVYPIQMMGGDVDLDMALKVISEAIHRETETDMIIIDSLTAFVTHVSLESTIGFFEDCKNLCNEGQTILIVVHNYAFNENLLVRVRSMCDAHLSLTIEVMGDKLLKSMEVSKVRGASHTTGNVVAFEIEPAWGMRIIPVSKARV